MTKLSKTIAMLTIGWLTITSANAQDMELDASHTLYDFAPRKLVDLPTAGTLPKGTFQIGLRIYAGGGALGYTDIGLSNRFSLGIAYGGTDIVSNGDPEWNPRIGFNLKFRIVDELEFFPAIAIGFSDQGYGGYRSDYERYTYKSRGFYGVVSRSFYFYKWTSGWHFGVNYSREHDVDNDKDINFFGGFDATWFRRLIRLILMNPHTTRKLPTTLGVVRMFTRYRGQFSCTKKEWDIPNLISKKHTNTVSWSSRKLAIL